MLQRLTIGDKTASWQRAIARAVEKDFERSIHYLGTAHYPDGRTEALFIVSSASISGKQYAVRLFSEPGRGVLVACDCEAGQRGQWFCWHEAAAALMSGLMLAPSDAEEGAA